MFHISIVPRFDKSTLISGIIFCRHNLVVLDLYNQILLPAVGKLRHPGSANPIFDPLCTAAVTSTEETPKFHTDFSLCPYPPYFSPL